MKCTSCLNGELRSYNTHMSKRLGCIVRKRICNKCGYTVFTVEISKNTYQKDHEFMTTLIRALDKYNEVKNTASTATIDE